MIRLSVVLLAAVFMLAGGSFAAAAERVALVIGNSAYRHVAELANPKNDAEAMSAALERLGFQVIKGTDLTREEFEDKVRQFARAIGGSKIALFFYAGHGLQVNGANYLAPVETQLLDEADLDFETVRLETILRQMEREPRTNLVFLDACRNNPMARNLARSMGTRSAAIGRGLAPIETGVGSMIAFATQPGNVALDGDGLNSPFTAALVRHIETPGEDIAVILRRVRQEVIEQTSGKQVPWDNSSLTGRVVLKAKLRDDKGAPAPAENGAEIAYWNSIEDQTDKSFFEAYLKQFPNGVFSSLARLTIAKLEKRTATEQKASSAGLVDNKEAKPETASKLFVEPPPTQPNLDVAKDPKNEGEVASPAQATARAETKAGADPPTQTAALNEPTAREPAETEKVDRSLVRSIQSQLNRLGCHAGAPDGIWGNNSRQALARLARARNTGFASLDPTPGVLDSLTRLKAPVCRSEPEQVAPETERSIQDGGFDGAWRLGLTATSSECGWKQRNDIVTIVHGKINASNKWGQRWTGSVAENGRLKISVRYNSGGRNKTRIFIGTVANNGGRGTFSNSSFNCRGRFTMSRK